jgi:hypothetical protein
MGGLPDVFADDYGEWRKYGAWPLCSVLRCDCEVAQSMVITFFGL